MIDARLSAVVIAATVIAGLSAYAEDVPLPRPRPPQAPHAESGSSPGGPSVHGGDAGGQEKDGGKNGDGPSRDAKSADAPPPPSPCRIALTENIAVAPSIPPISGPGQCGGTDLVRLEAVVMPDKGRVTFKPPAILRCQMATALANWVRDDLAALARVQGAALMEIDNFDSYECRGRNRVIGGKLSEHGKANAIDIRGVRLVSGVLLGLTDRAASREFRDAVRASVCARFATVLGPGSDWYHEDHVHLDLAERRSNFRLCQWDLFDQIPENPPLPAARPAEAPPRENVRAGRDKSAE